MKRKMARAAALAGALTLVATAVSLAQIAGGMDETTRTDLGGRNFIAGTVFSPNGLPINGRMRIRLASLTSREVITTTDDYGKFVFSGLAPGSYTVNIDDDKDFEPMVQQIDIENPRNALPETYTISFRLIPKAHSSAKADVVRTENVGVPKKAMDLYKKGLELSNAGDIPSAIIQLKAAISIYPKFMLGLTELGVQYLKTAEYNDADKSFTSALALDADAYEPNINLGISLFRQNRFADSEIYLRKVIKLREGSLIAHFYLGRALMGLAKFDDGEAELKNTISLSKDTFIEAHRMLAQLYIQKADYPEARKELQVYLTANPNSPDKVHLATVLKQLTDAIAATQKNSKP